MAEEELSSNTVSAMHLVVRLRTVPSDAMLKNCCHLVEDKLVEVEEADLISNILIWELLTIYLGTSLAVRTHLQISSMMKMISLEDMDFLKCKEEEINSQENKIITIHLVKWDLVVALDKWEDSMMTMIFLEEDLVGEWE